MTITYTLKISFFLLLLIEIINPPVCNNNNPFSKQAATSTVDLNDIIKRKKLVALVDNSTTSYFIYKGEPMGYEYEMLSGFAKYIGAELKVVIAKDMNTIFDVLNSNGADIIAANLTVTEDRMKRVDFTEPLILTKQVLIQKKPDRWEKMSESKINEQLVKTTIDLDGKTIYVRKGSSFYERLKNIEEEIAGKINIVEVPGDISTEALIAMVANGKIPFTIADENVAMVNQTYYPEIDIKTSISFPQKIAWSVRKKSPLLLAELNNWIVKKKNEPEYAVIYNKYFKNSKSASIRKESEFSSLSSENKISTYDELIKVYSREIGWDWRLLASMIYQESKFNPEARSWMGASGLMQMMPSTAAIYGIDTCGATAIESIDAGTKHLLKLNAYWEKFIPDKEERIKFVLGSYNVGLGHIIDARHLANKYGKHGEIWFDNVETYVLLKTYPKYYNDPVVRCGYCRGQEPYNYVRSIIKRYEHYKNVVY